MATKAAINLGAVEAGAYAGGVRVAQGYKSSGRKAAAMRKIEAIRRLSIAGGFWKRLLLWWLRLGGVVRR